MATESNQFEAVSIRSISKAYGEFFALNDVSLEVKAGEFVSLLGPSGSGKTTLLSILGGFTLPTSGEVYFGKTDVTLVQPHLRNIGVVFQSYALFPHMTVGENVAFALRARGVSKADCARPVNQALQLVELAGYEDRRIAQLSGGQKQRVALARAIVFEPKLILLDEPLSALDKQLRETMQIELRRLHDKLGATMIYVTHDQREALTMSDRVAVMRNGRLEQIDTPRRLHDFPINDFVANFVGETTLLPVRRMDGGGIAVGPSPLRSSRPVPEHGALAVAIHAEKLLIDDATEGDAWNRLSGRVSETIYQGESNKIFIILDGGARVSLRQPCHFTGNERLPKAGDSVTVLLHVEDTIIVPVSEKSYGKTPEAA
jgi:putative spermidine/putrescine transport system ATP-binding protein